MNPVRHHNFSNRVKKFNKIILNWIFVLLWMGVIYYFSDQPNLKSDLAPLWDTIFRKLAHMAEFFVLAYLLFRAYHQGGIKQKYSLFLAAFIAVIYAISDEWHQSLVEGRTSSNIDVMVDSIGIIIFAIIQTRQFKRFKQS